MPDTSLILDGLYHIEESLLHLLDRTSWIKTVDDFASTPSGMDMLDVAAMRLMAVGEEIRKIDKRSAGKLLLQYPEIEWRKIVGLRNVIAHEYFEIDATIVLDTLQNKISPLLATIQKIIADLER